MLISGSRHAAFRKGRVATAWLSWHRADRGLGWHLEFHCSNVFGRLLLSYQSIYLFPSSPLDRRNLNGPKHPATRLDNDLEGFHAGSRWPAPIYFMVVRIFDNFFGHTDFSVRLPSALAMTAGLLLTFDCARRLTDGLHGLIALSVLSCSFLPYYGHEARSYALYFMFASLALWIWAYDKDGSRLGAVYFGAAIFLAVGMHYYAILCLVPYAVWEAWNWKPWRLPSHKMIGGLLGVGCAAA